MDAKSEIKRPFITAVMLTAKAVPVRWFVYADDGVTVKFGSSEQTPVGENGLFLEATLAAAIQNTELPQLVDGEITEADITFRTDDEAQFSYWRGLADSACRRAQKARKFLG